MYFFKKCIYSLTISPQSRSSLYVVPDLSPNDIHILILVQSFETTKNLIPFHLKCPKLFEHNENTLSRSPSGFPNILQSLVILPHLFFQLLISFTKFQVWFDKEQRNLTTTLWKTLHVSQQKSIMNLYVIHCCSLTNHFVP